MTATKPWDNDTCKAVSAKYMVYSVAHAAALWCGISEADVKEELAQAMPANVRGVLRHPYIPCLEPRCKAIHDAIVKKVLPASREDGQLAEDHIAPERRYVNGENLRRWIEAEFPIDRPALLFDPSEQISASKISHEAHLALKAELDARDIRLQEARRLYRALKQDRDSLEAELNNLKSQLDQQGQPGERAEKTYLNIIGGLLGLMLDKTPGGQQGSIYKNQSAVIDALQGNHPSKAGLSTSLLESKFAAAKRSLGSA